MKRRTFLHLAAGAVALPNLSRIARAETYPSRPVRIVVGYVAGSTPDTFARLLGQRLSEQFGQQFTIENRPGAGSNAATEAVVRAPADGYTLLLVTTTNAINASLYDKLNFNFIHDIAPVASISRVPLVLEVNPSIPVRTVPEFVAYAKANPGKLNFASSGIGTASHVAGELFKMSAGVDMLHVPYRNTLFPDLLSGRVPVYFGPIPSSSEYIKSGKLRALAVTTAERSEALPDLPTVGEFLTGYEASSIYGLGTPKDTPVDLITKLNTEMNRRSLRPE
jgi:tripartite-type tricarboxylate transporter receptor subunit TctC